MTSELRDFFDERSVEIAEYMALLQTIEDVARTGPPRLDGAVRSLTPSQLGILNSSVYLQLYNLVEATVSRCLTALADTVADGRHRPIDLNMSLRNEWIRSFARTHVDLTPANRHAAAVGLMAHVADAETVRPFQFEVGGGGNWDEHEIEKASQRVGCDLAITPDTYSAIKKHVRDERGSLELVRDRRNRLAHGSLSFVDCSDGVTAQELRTVVERVVDYLGQAVDSFDRYITDVAGVTA